MGKKSVLPSLDEVVEKTIKAMEEGKSEIFEIAENSRSEINLIKSKLAAVQKKMQEVIVELDRVERLEKASRVRLLEVSRDIKEYTEEDIRKAYLVASNLQAEVRILRNTEKQLYKERTELERQYKSHEDTVHKAEHLISQVGVALDYLKKSIEGINNQLEEIEARGNLGARIIKAQEEERRRVARDIHDGPAQFMANIVLRAEYCERVLDKDVDLARKELKQLKEMVRDSLRDVRKIIYDLRPMTLDDLGLIPALSRYIEDFMKRTKLQVHFYATKITHRLPNTLEVSIYRVVQEALNNVAKHAQAQNVWIFLNLNENALRLAIRDDGQGFNVSDVINDVEREGYGILGMKERIELLGGEFNIESRLTWGTKITVTVNTYSLGPKG